CRVSKSEPDDRKRKPDDARDGLERCDEVSQRIIHPFVAGNQESECQAEYHGNQEADEEPAECYAGGCQYLAVNHAAKQRLEYCDTVGYARADQRREHAGRKDSDLRSYFPYRYDHYHEHDSSHHGSHRQIPP